MSAVQDRRAHGGLRPRGRLVAVGGLVLLAVAAGVLAPVGWGWLPAVVAWGWAVWRSPRPGDLLDRAVPVVLVGAAALQTLGWVTPWLPGRDGPWWLVVVVAPFVLRRGATVGQPALTWRTVGYTAAGLLPAAVMTWSWWAADTGRRLSLFGWATDYARHAEILREVLTASGVPAALEPATTWSTYPAGPHVVLGSWLTAAGVGPDAGPAALVSGALAGVTLGYAALGCSLAWMMRRVVDLLPAPGRRTCDAVGCVVVVVSLLGWPFPALLMAGFPPFPVAVAAVVAACGIVAGPGGAGDPEPPQPRVLLAVASAAVVVVGGCFPLALVVPAVAWGAVVWRVRDGVGDAAIAVAATLTCAATMLWLVALAGLGDPVAWVRARGAVPVVALLAGSALVGWLAVVGVRRLGPRLARVELRPAGWYAAAYAVLVLGFAALSATVGAGGAVVGVPSSWLAGFVAVVVAGWCCGSRSRTLMASLRPVLVAAGLSTAALLTVGVAVSPGIPYYVEKSLFVTAAVLLAPAVAVGLTWVTHPRCSQTRRGVAAAAIATALAAVVLSVVPREGSAMSAGGGLAWVAARSQSEVRALIDGPGVLAVADAVAARGRDAHAAVPLDASALDGAVPGAVVAWYTAQSWLWALTGTYRQDAFDVATSWWLAAAGPGARDGDLATRLAAAGVDRVTVVARDAGEGEVARRALAAAGVDDVRVVVVDAVPGPPFDRVPDVG